MSEATYMVGGMTCGHCANSVTRELRRLTGVSGVDVEVDSGRVVVTSARPLGEDAVRVAVAEAGFELVE